MLEKDTPKYKLEKVRKLLSEGNYNITDTAIESAFDDFELEEYEIMKEVETLKENNFYKSMKSQQQSGWQDVYRKLVKGVEAYIKITIYEGKLLIVISFKRRF
ncbi:MAG: type II toxin-antitoxin system MqsR family toxin [Leptospiraceae bacterium]|nr:type II toxin-antitoxin system MqsR family toxin [Leptospiraceae bacterium]MCP5496826.1 type II toxin-antitoxin system MqsR family toxin [Leptospiraceae bacterium]